MFLSQIRVAVVVFTFMTVALACAESPGRGTEENAAQPQLAQSAVVSAKDFARSRFDDSTNVTNKWFR